MAYKLKWGLEPFTVVDGPFAKRTFVPGMIYQEIPSQEARRFEEIKPLPEPIMEAGVDKNTAPITRVKKQTAAVDAAAENREVQ